MLLRARFELVYLSFGPLRAIRDHRENNSADVYIRCTKSIPMIYLAKYAVKYARYVNRSGATTNLQDTLPEFTR